MNPRIARNGLSFKGAWQYYMHDPKAETRNRVAWAETYGTITEDVDKAWKIMAYTAKHQNRLKEASGQKMTGRKDTRPVMAYSLSWHPDHDPGRDHMRDVAIQSIKLLGLEEHEAFIVAHRDTPHKHVHVIVNRIHPQTGLVASSSNTWRKLSEFARIYQKEHNMDYCPKREENYQKRQQGEQTRYYDPKIQEAWDLSDNGRSFVAALEENGYKLAQGRKRLVVVDPYGKIHNPVRHIEGIKTKDFNERLGDIDQSQLPDADTLAKEAAARHEDLKKKLTSEKRRLSEEFGTASASSISHIQEQVPEQESEASGPKFGSQSADEIAILNRLQDRHFREQSDLSQHFQRRIQNERASLLSFYKLREQREAISIYQEKCRKPSFWRRLFGLARKDQQQLQNLKLGYRNAKKRFSERIIALDSEYAKNMTDLKNRQKLEQANARKLIYDRSNSSTRRSSREYLSDRNRGASIEPYR